jgi:hypothetical protein
LGEARIFKLKHSLPAFNHHAVPAFFLVWPGYEAGEVLSMFKPIRSYYAENQEEK